MLWVLIRSGKLTCYPLLSRPMHSIVSNDSVSWQQRPWSDCAYAKADLRLCCPHMPKDMFLHGAAHMMHHVGKQLLCHMWTAQAQISMRIHAVCSEHSLFINIYYSTHWFCKQATRVLISLHEGAGWSWPALSVTCIRALFMQCTSYAIWEVCGPDLAYIFVKFFPFRVNPFPEGNGCRSKQKEVTKVASLVEHGINTVRWSQSTWL